MAPEQSVGDAVGPTSDLYSLGCVLYEMLAGEPPFTAKNPQALMARHAMEAVPSIRIIRQTVPEEVEDAIFAAMAKVPADRPQNAAQFSEILGAQLGQTASMRATLRHTAARRMPTGVHRTGAAMLAPPWWRKPWVMATGAVVLLGAGFGGYKLLAKPNSGTLSAAERAFKKQIAVLYFDVADNDSTLAPVADGLTDALIKTLRGARLQVRPGTSVAPFRDKDVRPDSIAKALGVGTIIEGSIRPEGKNQVRITTRISDQTGSELAKPANFLISRDSLFKAEDAVAGNVANGLRTILGQLDLGETRARAGNLRAYSLYNAAEKSRKDADQAARSDPKQAGQLFATADSLAAAAVTADAKWIDPLILRGEISRQRAVLETDKLEKAKWIQGGEGIVEQALKLDKNDANALLLRGRLRFAEWQLNLGTDPATRAQLLQSAAADLGTAGQSDPTLASAFATLSEVNYQQHDVPAALKNAQSAWDADQYLRNADFILYRLFWTNYDLANFPDATKWCNQAAERFPADYRFVACKLWLQLIPNGRPDIDESWRLAARVESLAPKTQLGQLQTHVAKMVVGGVIGKVARGTAASATGPLADSAGRVLERARADLQVDPKQDLVGFEGLMRTQMGDFAEAFSLLKRYVALNPDHSFIVAGRVHWWWQELVNKPEFKQLQARSK
jgi:serine/threonine-protein kinase